MDSCKELPVLLPHADHRVGSVPVSSSLSSLYSAICCNLLQLLGKEPTKALLEMLSMLRLGGKSCGKDPDKLLYDRSSSLSPENG